MKKVISIILILVMELYGVCLLGYYYSISHNGLILGFLIGMCLLALISSIVSVKLLNDKPQNKNWEKCPYFIDKE